MDPVFLKTVDLESLLKLKNRYKLVENLEEISRETFINPINDDMLFVISEKCSKLFKMNLQESCVTNNGLKEIFRRCTKLHTLKVNGCKTG